MGSFSDRVLKNAIKWAKCHEAISFLLEEKMIYDHEYSQIRERMIECLCSDSEEN